MTTFGTNKPDPRKVMYDGIGIFFALLGLTIFICGIALTVKFIW